LTISPADIPGGGGVGDERQGRTAAGAAARLAGATVLVAEDDAVIALDLEATLRGLGCRVLGPAASAGEALALLAAGRPDAALLDVELLDGWSGPAAEALARAGVPFALVTGHDPASLDGHPALRDAPLLLKPYTAAALERVLLRLLPPGRGDGAS
jgi:CheY-like chemotaxis protein